MVQALSELESAAARVASLARDVRGGLEESTPGAGAPTAPDHAGRAPGSDADAGFAAAAFATGSPMDVLPGAPAGTPPHQGSGTADVPHDRGAGPSESAAARFRRPVPSAPVFGDGRALLQPRPRAGQPMPGQQPMGPAGAPPMPPAAGWQGEPAAPITVDPWWSNEKAVLKIISAVGALIVIAGVGLLIVLAIESGLLGPLGRVILAYALAVALAGAAAFVHTRDRANVGVTALAIASLSTAHLTTMSLVMWLQWWDGWLGLAVVLAVTGLAYAAARVRDSKALLITAGLTGMWAALNCVDYTGSAMQHDSVLVIALLIPAAMAPVWWGRHGGQAVSVTTAVVFLVGSALMYGLSYDSRIFLAVHPIVAVVLAAMTFLDRSFVKAAYAPIPLPRLMRPGPQGMRYPIAQRPAGSPVFPLPRDSRAEGVSSVNLGSLSILAWSTVPLMAFAGPETAGGFLFAVAFGLIIGALGLPIVPLPEFGWRTSPAPGGGAAGGHFAPAMIGANGKSLDPRRETLALAGFLTAALPAFLLAIRDPGTAWEHIPVAVIAAVIVWVCVYKPSTNGRAFVGVWTAAAVFGNWPAIALTIFSPNYLRENGIWLGALAARNVHLSGLLLGVIALGLLAMVVVHRNRAGGFEKICGLVGLALTAVPVVTLLTAIGLRFSLAHMLVSIGWMVAAGWLMLAPKRLNVDSNLAGALVIAGAAVLKLVFYDMQAMHGITRVMAFLVCGIILLAMAVIRSRKDDTADANAGAGGPGGPGKPGGPGSPAGPGGPGGPGGPNRPGGPNVPNQPGPGSATAGAPRYGQRPGPNPGPGRTPGDGWGVPPSGGQPPRG